MKKILFFIPTLGGGGAEKVLVNLVNNIDKREYEVTIQTLFDYGVNRQNLNKDVKYKYVFKKLFRGNIHFLKIFSPSFLYKRMINEKYDIIVSFLEGPTTRIVSGCDDNHTKIISWIHTEEIESFKKSYRNFKEMKNAYLKYDMNVFVSKTIKEKFEKKMLINLMEKSCILKNVIDNNFIETKANELIEKDKKNGNVLIVSCGRLIKLKGYDRLLRVHKRLLDNNIKNELWILGEGSERKKLEKYVMDNKLESSVTLLGYKENPYAYVKKADVYVCSSYIEGYNTSVIEAIILKKPIITTKCSGMDEILENGKYGLIVENDEDTLYNGVKEMILNVRFREKYKKLAIERKKYFSMENQLKEIYKIFERC